MAVTSDYPYASGVYGPPKASTAGQGRGYYGAVDQTTIYDNGMGGTTAGKVLSRGLDREGQRPQSMEQRKVEPQ